MARFEAVYKETYGRITAYAARRCDSPQDAADVVADTFTVAWRRVDELPEGEQAMLWLYGVARKVLANRRRTGRHRQERNAELDAEVADLYGRRPDSGVELDAIARAFRELPGDDRELLSLVAWEGLDREEIATVLGLTRNAVRVRLYRARKRFARALAEADVPLTTPSRLVPAERVTVKDMTENMTRGGADIDALARALAGVEPGAPGADPSGAGRGRCWPPSSRPRPQRTRSRGCPPRGVQSRRCAGAGSGGWPPGSPSRRPWPGASSSAPACWGRTVARRPPTPSPRTITGSSPSRSATSVTRTG
ncbi:sigma-70 family RNA polymerase sigma factor [Nonomuraea sp. NPDC050691]|uniref:RNA polymerase sigma factor n=1 Tax=Nonomuraea sp. NPDC050691 TaxID=3155661 RepID=UPI003411C580